MTFRGVTLVVNRSLRVSVPAMARRQEVQTFLAEGLRQALWPADRPLPTPISRPRPSSANVSFCVSTEPSRARRCHGSTRKAEFCPPGPFSSARSLRVEVLVVVRA